MSGKSTRFLHVDSALPLSTLDRLDGRLLQARDVLEVLRTHLPVAGRDLSPEVLERLRHFPLIDAAPGVLVLRLGIAELLLSRLALLGLGAVGGTALLLAAGLP